MQGRDRWKEGGGGVPSIGVRHQGSKSNLQNASMVEAVWLGIFNKVTTDAGERAWIGRALGSDP